MGEGGGEGASGGRSMTVQTSADCVKLRARDPGGVNWLMTSSTRNRCTTEQV